MSQYPKKSLIERIRLVADELETTNHAYDVGSFQYDEKIDDENPEICFVTVNLIISYTKKRSVSV